MPANDAAVATPEAPAPPGPRDRARTRALVVAAVVLTVAALKLSEPVALPLVTAVFLLVLTRPLYCWVERRSARWLAALAAGGGTLELLGLVLAFFVLGLLDVSDFRENVRRRLRPPAGEALVQATGDIAHRVRRYLRALSITSAIGGVATGLFALLVGLDSPLTWGLVAFLLNYVPTIGPLLSVIPPSLFALLQFGPAGRAAVVFSGVGAIRFVIGNFIDPKIEGRALSLSPLVILVAVTFWGWMWGVLGALLAVPVTVAIVAVCERFEAAQWVPALLKERDP